MRAIARAADTVLAGLYGLCAILAALCVVAILALVLTSIASRLLGAYVPGLTEGAGYMLGAAGSLGLAHTFRAGGHIRVDLALSALGGAARRGVDLLALAVTAAAITYLAWYLLRLVRLSLRYGDISDRSDALPLWLPQLPIAAGIVVFAVALIHGLVSYAATGRSPVRRQDGNLLVDRDA
ncbi:TRAP transporter permease DctQ [Acuticoccus sediminis]|uniref:TRAP transporter small permease protein n=1 Tax=Acuticoccus sediminis TaxID=2184697 RepID=A0A8B2NPP9_9HYPH|nr:TRAP transporter small permease [Acuticoccus sediminis]RAI01865.1 TRAP transporter permease DctQ [Acuticoccus sediminis]